MAQVQIHTPALETCLSFLCKLTQLQASLHTLYNRDAAEQNFIQLAAEYFSFCIFETTLCNFKVLQTPCSSFGWLGPVLRGNEMMQADADAIPRSAHRPTQTKFLNKRFLFLSLVGRARGEMALKSWPSVFPTALADTSFEQLYTSSCYFVRLLATSHDFFTRLLPPALRFRGPARLPAT